MIRPRRPRHSLTTDSGQSRLDQLSLGVRSAITKTNKRSHTALNGRVHRNPPVVTLPTLKCLEPDDSKS